MSSSDNYRKIYAVVARIPAGRVATYGQVAALAGLARHARQVGYASTPCPTAPASPGSGSSTPKGR